MSQLVLTARPSKRCRILTSGPLLPDLRALPRQMTLRLLQASMMTESVLIRTLNRLRLERNARPESSRPLAQALTHPKEPRVRPSRRLPTSTSEDRHLVPNPWPRVATLMSPQASTTAISALARTPRVSRSERSVKFALSRPLDQVLTRQQEPKA